MLLGSTVPTPGGLVGDALPRMAPFARLASTTASITAEPFARHVSCGGASAFTIETLIQIGPFAMATVRCVNDLQLERNIGSLTAGRIEQDQSLGLR